MLESTLRTATIKQRPKKAPREGGAMRQTLNTELLNPTAVFFSSGARLVPDVGRRKRARFSRMFRRIERETSYEIADFTQMVPQKS